jgi:carbon-monoxide dehydrogenase large subunit
MDRKPRAEGGPYIGRSMPRLEDLRLVRGAGRYSDDISMPGQAYAVFVRSPHAHADIGRIDTAAARAARRARRAQEPITPPTV